MVMVLVEEHLGKRHAWVMVMVLVRGTLGQEVMIDGDCDSERNTW